MKVKSIVIVSAGLVVISSIYFIKHATNENSKNSAIIETLPKIANEKQVSLIKESKISSQIIPTKTLSSNTIKFQNDVLESIKSIRNQDDINNFAALWKSTSCSECVESLKKILANRQIDRDLRTNAALVLAKIGTRESVIALIHSLNKRRMPDYETKLLQEITSKSIYTIDNVEGISSLAYVLTGQKTGISPDNLPEFLANEMYSAITFFNDKNAVAAEIAKQFWGTNNVEIKNAIIELEHPQTLANLAIDAEKTGDIFLQKNLIERLSTSSNNDSLDALMLLTEKTANQNADVFAKLDEWTQNHVKTDRDGHLVDYLSNPDVSEKQREIAAELLTNITKNPDLLSPQENLQIQEALNKYLIN